MSETIMIQNVREDTVAVGRGFTTGRRGAGILGTGICLPDGAITNDDLYRRFGILPEYIHALSGIHQRRVAAPNQHCSDLAIAAGRQALEHAKADPDEIDMVLVATVSADYPFPATAALVQAGLEIPAAACMDLKAGCSGFVYGLTLACAAVSSGIHRKVLLVASEVYSKINDPDDKDCAFLFGDGAGAVVVGPVPDGFGLLATEAGTDGSGHEALIIKAGGSRLPPSRETLDLKLQFARMDKNQVFSFSMRVLGDSIQRLLEKAGLAAADIDLFIPHQPNRRIIEAAARRLDLPLDRFVVDMEEYGNIASASIPVALHNVLAQGRIRDGDLLVFTGFGAGLSWGSVLLRWHSAE